MPDALPRIAVLGASGLIGEALSRDLLAAGVPVIPLARRFTGAQRAAFGRAIRIAPLVELTAPELAEVLGDADIAVNCIGILQDGPKGSPDEVHIAFVGRLLGILPPSRVLVHVSIPQAATPHTTAFSLSKREAEDAIRKSGLPYVILRPGFVVGEAAYGGSALIRALAAWPITLPPPYVDAAFAATDVHDLGRAVLAVAKAWQNGRQDWAETWDVLEAEPTTVGQVIATFRRWLGLSGRLVAIPRWALILGTRAGDAVALLGWSPPIRSTALAEMRRGVVGDPRGFTAATGIGPRRLTQILADRQATVQEKWFGRLYMLKPLIFVGLAVFWCLSGLIALFPAFEPAMRILTSHGVAENPARLVTVVSSCLDIIVGVLIACRPTSALGLWSGIVVSLAYMLGAAVLTPDMWIEPLGALVKTGPAIVLMAVALAMLEER